MKKRKAKEALVMIPLFAFAVVIGFVLLCIWVFIESGDLSWDDFIQLARMPIWVFFMLFGISAVIVFLEFFGEDLICWLIEKCKKKRAAKRNASECEPVSDGENTPADTTGEGD